LILRYKTEAVGWAGTIVAIIGLVTPVLVWATPNKKVA
jgi:hypothetical protein